MNLLKGDSNAEQTRRPYYLQQNLTNTGNAASGKAKESNYTLQVDYPDTLAFLQWLPQRSHGVSFVMHLCQGN